MNSLVRIGQTDLEPTAATFRSAMRQLPGGVSVITVGRDRDISGMTVTSVTSLSAEPPSLLVCVNRSSSSWPLFERYGAFAVNILHADQQQVAEQFAGRVGVSGYERFAGISSTTLLTGVPIIADALTSVDCTIEEIIPRHSHAIVIGRVVAIRRSDEAAALAYWQSEYVTLGTDEDTARLAEVGLPIPSFGKL
jgi:flavin reductase (DIM6/NTAB) family NADH-FMN oxidoreductase RutF